MTDQTESASEVPTCSCGEYWPRGLHHSECEVVRLVRALEAKAAAFLQQLVAAQHDILTISTDRDRLSEALTVEKRLAKSWQETAEKFRAERDRLESANRGLAAEVTRLNAAGRELSRQCGSQAQEIGVLRPERDRLAGEVERLEIVTEGQEMQIDGMMEDMARLTAELAAARRNDARWKLIRSNWVMAGAINNGTQCSGDTLDRFADEAIGTARRAGEGEK